MFKELGAIMGLLRNGGKIQEEMKKFQEQLGAITAEGSAGAGYVTVKANGRQEVVSVRISAEAVALNDREMLEDLVAAAANQALTRAKEQVAQESAKLAASMGLPAGVMGGGLPGTGG
jgi:DNA-binding YbaB/EbfC family protein